MDRVPEVEGETSLRTMEDIVGSLREDLDRTGTGREGLQSLGEFPVHGHHIEHPNSCMVFLRLSPRQR
ncbi:MULTISPECIES: hypothetical protein [unclassified Methanoculleus]|uniref:hypothetical protein n=1 Tax=unclassified Methanoculleus TaxID=2619537 RepID=UPI0037446CF2